MDKEEEARLRERYALLDERLAGQFTVLSELEDKAKEVSCRAEKMKEEMRDILLEIYGYQGFGFISKLDVTLEQKRVFFKMAMDWGIPERELPLYWAIRGTTNSLYPQELLPDYEGQCDGCGMTCRLVKTYLRSQDDHSSLCAGCEGIMKDKKKKNDHAYLMYCDHIPHCEGVRRRHEQYG